MLRTTSMSTLVPTSPDRTWVVIGEIVAALWQVERLVSEPARILLHSVLDEAGGEPACWLTWTVEACSGGATQVRCTQSEQADYTPEPELDAVLLHVLSRCVHRADSASTDVVRPV